MEPRPATDASDQGTESVRIFLDGVFDLSHYGHMNAFRLAKSLGTHLIVGINSDETIIQCKGPPLYSEAERTAMVTACKFVDEIVPNCPYVMSKDYVEWVMAKYNIDYIVHGDDPCIVDGKDVYATAKDSGEFQYIPRTEGVSTTDIIGRVLKLTKNDGSKKGSFLGQQSQFLGTGRLLREYTLSLSAPSEGMRIVYIDGAWDLFHPGHVAILEAAKARGDFLIVGIYGDHLINSQEGNGDYPLMNSNERVLGVLACRFVDDVVMDAPQVISSQMIASLKIAEVIHCNTDDCVDVIKTDEHYKHAKNASILRVMDKPSDFGLHTIVTKTINNQEALQTKYTKKKAAEENFYKEKYNLKDQNGHA